MPHETGSPWNDALARPAPAAPWRDVGALLGDEGSREAAAREFAPGADEPPDVVSRRTFVKLLGLGSVAACERPLERILPYTHQPPEVTPGIPRYYATSMVVGGYATGLLVESHAGRPVKVEGNPDHPASLGAAGVYEQAAPLDLYDPGRARRVLHAGRPSAWNAFLRMADAPDAGEGLHFLLEPTGSPLLQDLLRRIRERHPDARVHFHAPLAAEGAWAGSRLAFGRTLLPQYDFAAAEVILSLDADFLGSMPFHLRYARQWAEGRRLAEPGADMSRLYVAEGMLSVTGGAADHRLRVRPSQVRAVAAEVMAELDRLGVRGAGVPDAELAALAAMPAVAARRAWVRTVAADLAAHRGRSVVVAGERQGPEVHALAHLLNDALGNLGRTVHLTEPVLAGGDAAEPGIVSLARAIRAGEVRTLVVLGGDPAATAPADLGFATLLETVPTTVCLDLFPTETARRCDWFLPALHFLESWGDARAYDGTVSIIQPLIRPLHPECVSESQVLAAFVGEGVASPHDLLRASWRGRAGADGGGAWDEALRRGVVPGTEAPRVDARPGWGALATTVRALSPEDGAYEAVFLQDPAVYDGRFAGNAWLMELPDPVTKLTWDNAAIVSPRTAAALGVDTGDVVRVEHRGRALEIPAFVLPGVADGLVALHLGYGRTGRAVEAVEGDGGGGFDVYPLRTAAAPYFARGASVEKVPGRRYPLATTQAHGSMEGRPIVLHASLAEYRENPGLARRLRGRTLSLYEPWPQEGVQWGMSIDLSLCTGCSACVVACQAENNVPVVGKAEVMRGREMHWLRIDRYFAGTADDPVVLQQPMLCQHCEKAPCEYVCPVNATTHSPDGLNEMTYSRCIGTRFCSNNCPYKVRRFNWFDYHGRTRGTTLEMGMNPDVTVRDRGVIEKCTFCVQRIRRAGIDARIAGEDVQHAELRTACQQACPTRAIRFGALTDPESPVAQAWRDPRAYSVLHHLGTEPRIRYLARISNRAGTLAPSAPGTAGAGEAAG